MRASFWNLVQRGKPEECWVWIGYRMKKNGKLNLRSVERGWTDLSGAQFRIAASKGGEVKSKRKRRLFWEVCGLDGTVWCSSKMKLDEHQARNVVENNLRRGAKCYARKAAK